ncbi:MAG: hypothetical protein K0U20_08830 [Proteobacteria bacterium]|nr:hypothetical protein [Pseudomonadota bacterium]
MTQINDLLLKSPIAADDEFEIQETGAGTSLKTTLQDIENFIHTGAPGAPDADVWTGRHAFTGLIMSGPTVNDAVHSFTVGQGSMFLANPGGTDTQGVNSPLNSFLLVEDAIATAEYFAFSTFLSIANATEDNVDPFKPFNVFNAATAFNPGVGRTVKEVRGVDYDFQCNSGTLQEAVGATARVRYNVGSVVDEFTGFKTIGPTQADTAGTLTDYIGFRATWEDRVGASGTVSGDFIGLQVDSSFNIHPSMTVTGNEYGIWLNGADDLNGDVSPGIFFGVNKNVSIKSSAVFGSDIALKINTPGLEFSNAAMWIASGVNPAVLGPLPAGATGTTTKWLKFIDPATTQAVYVPAFTIA